jgi:four helix bundle protein
MEVRSDRGSAARTWKGGFDRGSAVRSWRPDRGGAARTWKCGSIVEVRLDRGSAVRSWRCGSIVEVRRDRGSAPGSPWTSACARQKCVRCVTEKVTPVVLDGGNAAVSGRHHNSRHSFPIVEKDLRPRGGWTNVGTPCALLDGVRDFRDLVAWQLSDALRSEVVAFTEGGPAARDFKYRDQIRDASASAPRNIAEGFGRYRPAEFARFLEFAVASLEETKDGLIDGCDRGYLDPKLYSRLRNLAGAAERVTRSLLRAKRRQVNKEVDERGRNRSRRQ